MKANNNKYKILVLSDLKGNTTSTLRSSANLAKMIGGDVEFFHVKSPTEIVENDNQLAANRAVNLEFTSTNKKIKNMMNMFSKDYGAETNINFKFTFGNVKNEIEKRIDEVQPDIIVLGKKKVKPLKFIGDNITQFILKKHQGSVMIVSDKNGLDSTEEISLGILNGNKQSFNMDFAKSLLEKVKGPLNSFNIVKGTESVEKVEVPTDQKVVEYVFDENDNSIKNLSHYLLKNNINLLCINRESKKRIGKSNIDQAIGKLNVSLLVAN